MQLTSTTTNRAKHKLATYRMSEVHDNHADKSSSKTEVSIPNPPGFGHQQLGWIIREVVAKVNAVLGVVLGKRPCLCGRAVDLYRSTRRVSQIPAIRISCV